MDFLNQFMNIQQLVNMVASYSVLVIVILLGLYGVTYAMNGFQTMHIARKAGLEKDWMAFVPFAHSVYRLQIADEQWWKMFFIEYSWLYGFLLYTIINAVSNNKWRTFAVILVILYLGCCIAYRIFYRRKYYTAFGIKPTMAILFLTPWGIGVRIFDLAIAFTDNFVFTGEGTSRTISGTMKSVVNKPGSAQPQQAGRTASITGLSGMYAGQDLPLADGEEMVIGRDNAMCNLIVDQNAEKVSRKHCSITFDSRRGAYQVTDFSTNGTFIDGGNRLVANMPTQLQRGTVIALGSRENRFKLN